MSELQDLQQRFYASNRRIAELELEVKLLVEANAKLGRKLLELGAEINKRGAWKVALGASQKRVADLEEKLKAARKGEQ
jgi:chromosome segregation ATPase